jgi:hypothetical protein
VDDQVRRFLLTDTFAGLQRECHHGNNVVATADAGVAAGVIAAGAPTGEVEGARIREIAGIHLRTRYEEQDDCHDSDHEMPLHRLSPLWHANGDVQIAR